jgi:hypothetical protein
MVVEERQLIELAELSQLRFECRHAKCGAVLTVRIKAGEPFEPPVQCPACGRQWLVPNGASYNAVGGFMRRLRDTIAVDADEHEAFGMRFEIVHQRP